LFFAGLSLGFCSGSVGIISFAINLSHRPREPSRRRAHGFYPVIEEIVEGFVEGFFQRITWIMR